MKLNGFLPFAEETLLNSDLATEDKEVVIEISTETVSSTANATTIDKIDVEVELKTKKEFNREFNKQHNRKRKYNSSGKLGQDLEVGQRYLREGVER